jgi:porin
MYTTVTRCFLAPLPLLLAAGVAAFPATAQAGDPGPFSNTLIGNPGGWRSDLYNDGIDFNVGYTTETAANLQGGTGQLVRYTDQLTFGTTLDLQKLAGLNNAKFQFTITDRNGRNLSDDGELDSLQQVQEVFGRGQTWRLTQLWYNQTYFNDVLDLKIGRLTEGEDFAAFSCEFMNLTFCGAPPGNLVGDYWFNWPVSQWAERLKANIAGFGYVMAGAYQVNPTYLTDKGAINFGSPAGTTGALIPVEIAWLPSFGSSVRLAGSYKFGAWYNTSDTADPVENTDGQLLALDGGMPLKHNGAWGAYLNVQQKLTNPSTVDPDRGLSAFFNFTYADPQTATLDNQIALGLFYTGLFDSRPKDRIGIAIGRTHVSGRVADSEEAQNAAGLGPVDVQHSEYAAEIYYNVNVYNGVYLQPDLQYVHNPGGIEQNTDAIILGLKTHVDF